MSLNIDLSTLFAQVNTLFSALWPVAAITIGIPFALGLIAYIGNAVLRGLRIRS